MNVSGKQEHAPPLAGKQCKYAYVALVMKGDAYIPGAIVLAHSLKRTGTLHDVVCMITPDVSNDARSALLAVYDSVVTVNYLHYPSMPTKTAKQQKMYDHWMSDSITMFQSLGLTQYAKICQLDVDIVVLRNMDSVFSTQAPAACFVNPWLSHGDVNKFYPSDMHHGQLVPKQAIQSALRSRDMSFVGGCNCIVIEPSAQARSDLERCMAQIVKTRGALGSTNSFSAINEQSMAYFYAVFLYKDMYCVGNEYQCVPWKHRQQHFDVPPYLFHYFNKKPWDMQGREPYPDVGVWWSLALECCREHESSAYIEQFLFGQGKAYTRENVAEVDRSCWASFGKCFWCKGTDHLFWDFKTARCTCPCLPAE
jgi:hypothetical protein